VTVGRSAGRLRTVSNQDLSLSSRGVFLVRALRTRSASERYPRSTSIPTRAGSPAVLGLVSSPVVQWTRTTVLPSPLRIAYVVVSACVLAYGISARIQVPGATRLVTSPAGSSEASRGQEPVIGCSI
jgi:hypothetical protein